MAEQIGLIGAGVMGQAIGGRLLECGHTLNVFDPDEARVAALVARGAVGQVSAADVASQADFVILSLNSAAIVESAVFGDAGVARGARDDCLIIDMSSIDPESTVGFMHRAGEYRLRWLDCPLSGGSPKAAVGELTVMAGGSEADFESGKSVMDSLCSNYTRMGDSGAGQTTKLINQVLCALNFMAVTEATQLALDNGVDAAKIPAALSGGRADSSILQEYMPRMAEHDFEPLGRLDNMLKDLVAVQDLARRSGTSMPLTALCTEIHRLLITAGLGSADNAALMRLYEPKDNATDQDGSR